MASEEQNDVATNGRRDARRCTTTGTTDQMLQASPTAIEIYSQLSRNSLKIWTDGPDEGGIRDDIDAWNEWQLPAGKPHWGPGIKTGVLAKMAEALAVAVGHHRDQIPSKALTAHMGTGDQEPGNGDADRRDHDVIFILTPSRTPLMSKGISILSHAYLD
eukprot:g76848.t1